MLLEVSSPLIVAPVVGNSINVWACLISIAIGALALGYFLGGIFLKNKANIFTISNLFLLNSLVLTIGWMLIQVENNYSINFDYHLFSWLIVFVILFIPLVLFGATTPILVAIMNEQKNQQNDIVGKIFSTSTFGGIAFSVLAGFYLIPKFGLSHLILIAIIITSIIPFIYNYRFKKIKKYSTLGIIIVFCLVAINKETAFAKSSNIKILNYSESVNGQLIVADMYKEKQVERILFVNRMGQTWMNLTANYSIWSYPNYITSVASILPENSNALVLGLGGGIIAKQLKYLNKFNVQAVELDERIIDISKKYFDLKNSEIKIYQDDARRFVKKTKSKYDFIVVDIFSGEIAPSHGLSKEAFEDIKLILNDKGIMVINFNGFLTTKEGLSGRALLKTLQNSGFKVKLFPTSEPKDEDRNMLYMAYLNEEPKWENATIHVNTPNGYYKIAEHLLDYSKIDLSNAPIITDDKPMMEYINRLAATKWRESYYTNFTLKFKNEYQIPFIY